MTTRISDERLAELENRWHGSLMRLHEDTASALRELQQSRALVTELRALRDNFRESSPEAINSHQYFAGVLDSLLSAHGGAEKP